MIRLLSILVVAATTIVLAQPGSATSYAYIADGSNPGHVTVVDVGKARIATVIDVGVQPIGIAISPDGKFVYVANTVTNGTGPGAVSTIDTASMSVVRTTQVGTGGIGKGGRGPLPFLRTASACTSHRTIRSSYLLHRRASSWILRS